MQQPYDLSLKELEKFKPLQTKQPDFDLFWENTLEELATVSKTYKLIKYAYPVKGLKVYRVSFTGFNHAPIDGWLAMPDSDKPLPGLVLYHGYNWAMDGCLHSTVNTALKGYAAFQMLVRGQQGASVDNVVPSYGYTTGWMTKGILDPKEYYYRAVYMDAVRALDILASIPGVDGDRIGVWGGSQGGGLSLAAAALSDIPKVCLADFPFLSHFERAIDIAPRGPYLEINEFFKRNTHPDIEVQAKKTLTYFDNMNLCDRIKCRTWMCAGLLDDITPPSTIYAVYNQMNCEKEIAAYRYFGHEDSTASTEPKLRLLMEMLQGEE